MRISDRTFYLRNTADLQARSKDVGDAQLAAQSGRRVRKPSDDPLAASMATRERIIEQRMQARQRGVDAAETRMDAQDGALSEVGSILQRARELTLQGTNDTLGAGERASIAVEIRALRESIVGLGNTQANGDYIFAGFASDAPAFDAAGAFVGDNNVPRVEVADGVRIDSGISAEDAFGLGGPDDLFTVLDDLATGLEANDEVAIRAQLVRIDSAHSTVTSARGTLGGQQQSMETARAVTQRIEDAAVVAQSDLVGVDTSEAYLEFQRAQQAYAAAVQIASQVPPTGLVGR